MNKVAFFSAITATAVGAVAGHLYLGQVELEAAGGGRLQVLIATQDLKPGDILKKPHLGVRAIPQAYVGSRNIGKDSVARIVGVRLNTRIKANEPILWSDVAALGTRGLDLGSAIQDGRRAYAISRGSGTFDGLLRAGDRVDILYTTGGGNLTKTLLQDILVLAVGGQMDPRSRRQRGGQTILSVDLQQSQLLATAEMHGTLRLVMRNPGDIAVVEKAPKTTKEQLREPGPPKQAASPRRAGAQTKKKEIERVR